MINSALVGTGTHGRISERNELGVVRLENLPGFIRTLLEHDDHVAAHEEGGVALLGVVERGVVVNLVATVLAIIH